MSGDPSKPATVRFQIVSTLAATPLSEDATPAPPGAGLEALVRAVYEPFVLNQLVQAWHDMGLPQQEIDQKIDAWQKATAEQAKREASRTPAEREDVRKAFKAKQDAELAERRQENLTRWEALLTQVGEESDILTRVVEFHEPSDTSPWEKACKGCSGEVSGYEYDVEDWPCQTFQLIEEAFAEKDALLRTTPPTGSA